MDYYRKLEQCFVKGEELSEDEQEILKKSDLNYVPQQVVLKMYQDSQRRIEKVKQPTAREKSVLASIENGECKEYQLYMVRISKEERLIEFREQLSQLYVEMPELRTVFFKGTGKWMKVVAKERKNLFSIRDLSDENENRKNGVIGNIIASEQRKNYIPNKSFPFMINMIKKSEDDYLCMITIYEQMECSKKKADIFYRLFHTREIRKLFYMQKQEKEGLFRSTEYWRNIFAKEIDQSGLGHRKNPQKEIRRGKKTRRKEVYLLDREASDLMEDIGQEHHVSIKSIFLAVWGVMLCKFFGQKEIVMGDLNRIGKMELIPIRVERSDNFKDMFLNIQKQITDAKEYDNYTLQELEVSLGYSLKEDMRVVHNFFDMPIIKDTFQSMAAFTVYHMEMPEAMQAAPLEVSYNLLSEIKRIQYCYEIDVFENVEIQQIHDNFAQLLKGILLAMKKQTDYKEDISDVVTAKKNNKELVQIAQIAYYLRQSKIFSTLVMEELLSLAKKCHLIKGVSEEVIIQDQSNVNSLYIIGEGKVVQNGVDRDSFVHTLQVLKEGDLFGVECICKNSVSEHSYVIYSDCAFVVEIPSEVIWQEMQKKPYLIREFLDWENNQIAKYQSLWIME